MGHIIGLARPSHCLSVPYEPLACKQSGIEKTVLTFFGAGVTSVPFFSSKGQKLGLKLWLVLHSSRQMSSLGQHVVLVITARG